MVRAFGRIKFKVRIITKSARYGIKLYVLTDARTAYVLRIIPYTGKSNVLETDDDRKKKTVQIVKGLVEDYRGSHRTVYIDRYYSSINVAVELKKNGFIRYRDIDAQSHPCSTHSKKKFG